MTEEKGVKMDRLVYFTGDVALVDNLGIEECMEIQEPLKKLHEYEIAEEQGLLAKVVHAEWVDVNGFTYVELPKGHKWCECSNCNFEIMNTPYNYCPNCGAKMSVKE